MGRMIIGGVNQRDNCGLTIGPRQDRQRGLLKSAAGVFLEADQPEQAKAVHYLSVRIAPRACLQIVNDSAAFRKP